MRKLANFIRSTAGRKSVPSGFEKHLSEKSKTLNDVYKEDVREFETDKEKIEKRPVVWADAEELLKAVLENKNQIGNFKIKVMADGGQGFLKFSMTILPEDYCADDCDNKVNNSYSNGGSLEKKSKLTSVNRLILLCVVPSIKESYENVKTLIDLTKLNNIPFKFVADFKLLLIVNGQQNTTSTYPRPYFFVTLNELRNSKNIIDVRVDENQENNLSLKTYSDLREDYSVFTSMGKQKKLAKECHSTINLPLFF